MLQKYREAVTPGVLAVIAIVAVYAQTGTWNAEEWALAATGLVLTTLTFFQANVVGWTWLKAIVPAIAVNIAVLTELLKTGDFDAKLWVPMAVALVTAALNLGLPSSAPVHVPPPE